MATNDMGFSSPSDDWSVILQSCSPKLKKELAKRISEIFELEKKDAEQALSNMPLILLDNLSFGMAARIKNFFVKLGAVVETTNHEMIKKNCYQVLWPEVPDLSFFLKDETKLASQEPLPAAAFPPEPNESAVRETPRPSSLPEIKPSELPQVSRDAEGWEKIMRDSVDSQISTPKDPDEKPGRGPVTPEPSAPAEGGWEKRARELSKKLASFQEDKKKSDEDIVLRAVEGPLSDLTRGPDRVPLEEREALPHAPEGSKPGPDAFATEPGGVDWRAKAMLLSDRIRDLEKDLIDSKETLVKEVEMLRSKAASAEGRAHEIETSLTQKSQELERVVREKEELSHHGFKVRDLEAQLEALQNDLAAKGRLISEKDGALEESQRELEAIRGREKESLQKTDSLQASVRDLERALRDRDEQLKVRDESLAAFEKQLSEFAAAIRALEPIRQEHAQLVHERGTIRKEYESKLAELEARVAKADDDNRRYRSRTDRKLAAATRELGEWVRGVEALRQGLQKLVMFLGSESAMPESEKKFPLRASLNRGMNGNNAEGA
ncbi:MAG: hypothetical protein KTQ49_02960 [Candidatus Omnitrophica bacterium]|nr:hypothetical protein [Candidatus Omnitrophota bacterium]